MAGSIPILRNKNGKIRPSEVESIIPQNIAIPTAKLKIRTFGASRLTAKIVSINPETKPDLSVLNGQEKEHIDWELHRLSDMTAKQLTDLSHKDVPWITAEIGKPIDYESVFYRTQETSIREYESDD